MNHTCYTLARIFIARLCAAFNHELLCMLGVDLNKIGPIKEMKSIGETQGEHFLLDRLAGGFNGFILGKRNAHYQWWSGGGGRFFLFPDNQNLEFIQALEQAK